MRYRQSIEDENNVNFFRLGISNGTANWYFYDVYPTNVNSTWTNQMWDYPRLALSNNYLYLASNMFTPTTFARTVLLRISLDDLKAHGALTDNYFDDSTHGTFTPVQGATSTIYWGTHHTNSIFRIFSWDENSTTSNYYDRTVPTWSYSDGTINIARCPGPDKNNWCARTDDRVI